jgi:hypothetical protein
VPKDEAGLHYVVDVVGVAVELPQEVPALEGVRGLLAEAVDPGIASVGAGLPFLEAAAPERYPDGTTDTLIRRIGRAFESRIGEGSDDMEHLRAPLSLCSLGFLNAEIRDYSFRRI